VRGKEILAAVRTSWWMVPLGIAVIGGGVLVSGFVRAPAYTSTTQPFVSTTDATSTTAVLQGSQFSEQRVASYQRLISGVGVARRVIDELGLDATPQAVSQKISASGDANTVLIDVSVTDSSARTAHDIAAALGSVFPKYAAELEATGPGGASPVKVTVTQPADFPPQPSSPKVLRDTVLASLVGLLVGLSVAIFRARADTSIKHPEQATGITGAPAIGSIFRDDDVVSQSPRGLAKIGRTAEDYRQLRTNLQFLGVDEPPRVIMISSAMPSEGKSTLAINLAAALAEAGHRVAVIEADLRRPKVTRYLGLVGGAGLTNVLSGSANVEEVLQAAGDNYDVLAAGPTPPNPGELLSSHHMFDLLEKFRSQYDYVLVDAPPLLPVADAVAMSVYVDGTLLSVKYGATRDEQLKQAALSLDRVNAKLLGVVLNIIPRSAQFAQAYGYGYNYEPSAQNDQQSEAV
jgi:capsular exopolysaccharide synthesis family protein